MPSVGMRRTTRVFGARVLRSGRRVWTGSGERKHMKTPNGGDWIDLLGTSAGGGGGAGGPPDRKETGWQRDVVPAMQEVTDMEVEEEEVDPEPKKLVHDSLPLDNNVGRKCINVYTRKRKKMDTNRSAGDEEPNTLGDKKFANTYSRKLWSKKWTKKIRLCEIADLCDPNISIGLPEDMQKTLKVIVQSSCVIRYSVASLLNSVLRYMRNSRIELNQLFMFFHSKSIEHVYSSSGIHFLLDSNLILDRGVCLIMGGNCFMPLFALDYSAVPFCFRYLHLSMLLQGLRLSSVLGIQLVDTEEKVDGITDFANITLTSGLCHLGKIGVSNVNVGAAKLASRNVQLRNARNMQKRSSFRSKRGRPPSSLSARKLKGALASNLFGFRQNGTQHPSTPPGRELRSSAQKSNLTNMKQVKSALVGLPRDADSTTCSANILVMESDRCYREQGAVISLEVSAKRQWYLAVNTGGMKRYSLIAEKVMRPCSCNRFTHAIIWAADSGWKLEFPDRHDWLVFKDLYKECSDRNMQVPVETCIPVPGVHEVPLCANSNNAFARPVSYIMVKDDELTRALTRRTANYDMDSDDEEWISKFNNQFSAEDDSQKVLSDEMFELIIDTFERGFHCNPDDYSDEAMPPNIGVDVAKGIVEAVYSYWIKKRKQKRSALVRVFQCYQPRRSQLIPKSVLRKKRSFKRQGSQAGRGKQRSFLHVMAAEHDAEEQKSAIFKVEEAKAAASRSEELAIQKRQRAQQLMENADLLTYKATMALRIAELARIAKLQDATTASLAQISESHDAVVVPLCSDKR